MKYSIPKIKETVNEIFPQIVALRRTIHMNPELSEHEEHTEAFICKQLDLLGITYENNIVGHGIIGYIPGKDTSKAFGIRADIDALPIAESTESSFKSINPEVMHACGHDIHTAILLGTAKILKSMKKDLPIGVKFFFQPSEETIGGAKQMIDAGCLQNPTVPYVIGLHVETTVPVGSVQFIPGSMNAASTEFYVTIKGKSSHGAHPNKGIDPLIPACEIVSGLQTIISRKMDPCEAGLITVGQFHSGQKNNIIPNETKFSGIIRALTLENRDFIKTQLKHYCEIVAEAHGAGCEVIFRDSYPSLENDDRLLETIKGLAEEALGKDKVIFKRKPSLGADDFSYFCHSSKGLYFNIGTQKDGDFDAAPIHSDCFDPDEECIKAGMLLEVLGMLKLMEDENGHQ